MNFPCQTRRTITVACAFVIATLVCGIGASAYDTTQNGRPNNTGNSPAAVTPTASAAGTYKIDPAHSTIGFSVRHMGLVNVPGRFREFSGTINYNPDDITKSSVEFTAQVASINTGVERRDEHLRNADFFDVAKHPAMTFKSNRVERRGDGYVAHGDFTLRGVTKQIAIPFRVSGVVRDARGNTKLGAEAEMTINRQDYGIAWSRAMEGGGLVVSNDVRIFLWLEANRQEPAKAGATK